MSLTVKGKITKILEVESGTSKAGKEWRKQVFVIDTGDQYNPEIAFSVFGDEKVEKLTKYNKVGQEVEVAFNVSSREYNGKYFHNLDAWKIQNIDGEVKPQEAEAESDDLPF